MKAVNVVLCIAVILAVCSSTCAQKRKPRNSGGGFMSKMGITPECIQFAKELILDGDSFNMEKMKNISQRFPQMLVKIMMPNPCSEVISKGISMAQSMGVSIGG